MYAAEPIRAVATVVIRVVRSSPEPISPLYVK
jgi:hypothetical protein